jgi:hypothetical protein
MMAAPGDLAALEVLDHDTLIAALAERYAQSGIYVRFSLEKRERERERGGKG